MKSDAIKCPCCGQVTVPTGAVRVDINENLLYFRGHSVPLTSRLAELALILARRMPSTVPHEIIMAQMWGGVEITDKSREVAVMQLRRAIRPFGLTIVNTYGVGYRMAEVSKTERRSGFSTVTGADHATA